MTASKPDPRYRKGKFAAVVTEESKIDESPLVLDVHRSLIEISWPNSSFASLPHLTVPRIPSPLLSFVLSQPT